MRTSNLKPNIASRIAATRQQMQQSKLDALLISSQSNRFYLTGWPADEESGYLLLTQKEAFIITDSRYTEEAVQETTDYQVIEWSQDKIKWQEFMSKFGIETLGFESKDLSVSQLKYFKKLFRHLKIQPTENLIESLRSVKDGFEIDLLRKSAEIASSAFEYILKNVKSGQSEREIAWELEKFMRQKGADKNAWENIIVASGENSSKVHYAAGERKIKLSDQVLLDWGCNYKGYCSDISRVFFLGTPSKKQAEMYNFVIEAQNKAIKETVVGRSVKKADLAARNFLRSKTDFAFGHSIGHGVGVDVHELPNVSVRSKGNFETGNVVTIEPGIYEPGIGGFRIEDMLCILEEKTEILTTAEKSLNKVIV